MFIFNVLQQLDHARPVLPVQLVGRLASVARFEASQQHSAATYVQMRCLSLINPLILVCLVQRLRE
jgi:hypothetical protein